MYGVFIFYGATLVGYIYIYIYRERERERQTDRQTDRKKKEDREGTFIFHGAKYPM